LLLRDAKLWGADRADVDACHRVRQVRPGHLHRDIRDRPDERRAGRDARVLGMHWAVLDLAGGGLEANRAGERRALVERDSDAVAAGADAQEFRGVAAPQGALLADRRAEAAVADRVVVAADQPDAAVEAGRTWADAAPLGAA